MDFLISRNCTWYKSSKSCNFKCEWLEKRDVCSRWKFEVPQNMSDYNKMRNKRNGEMIWHSSNWCLQGAQRCIFWLTMTPLSDLAISKIKKKLNWPRSLMHTCWSRNILTLLISIIHFSDSTISSTCINRVVKLTQYHIHASIEF